MTAAALTGAGAPGELDPIVPVWNGPANVHAIFTTRTGGASTGSTATLDLGPARLAAHDRDSAVAENRRRLRRLLPADPVWLEQVHGTHVVTLDAHDAAQARSDPPRADAALTRTPGVVLTVRTADCLPVLLADRAGSAVAVAHAGWRGLAAGVLASTLAAMQIPPREIAAWIGPAIGRHAFEVGRDVLDAFCMRDPDAASYFAPQREGKWHADLAGLGRHTLAALGVHDVAVHGGCTYSEPTRYFSYRRDHTSGRMALMAWLAAAAPPRSTPESQ
jgi:YfiH family protein